MRVGFYDGFINKSTLRWAWVGGRRVGTERAYTHILSLFMKKRP